MVGAKSADLALMAPAVLAPMEHTVNTANTAKGHLRSSG